MSRKLVPIALFVYNRPEHTRKTVEALRTNILADESELFIFSDGARPGQEAAVRQVRDYLKTVSGFRSVNIIEKSVNSGLARSIISGVTDIVNRYGAIIVLEDDLFTSPHFLQYMNDGLEMYKNDVRVASIHGYLYPVKKPMPETFFLRGADCWGWATWKRSWDKFEHDGMKLLAGLEQEKLTRKFDLDGSYGFTSMLKRQIAGLNDSWAIRWHASIFLADMLTLYPGTSLVDNIGQDNSGTHPGSALFKNDRLEERTIKVSRIEIEENCNARKVIAHYLKSTRQTILSRILRKASGFYRKETV